MVLLVILCKVKQILKSLWGLQGAKQHTSRFLMEGFWPSGCTPPCLVLKARKRKRVLAVITQWETVCHASKPQQVELEGSELDLSSWWELTLKAFWDGEGSIVTGAGHRVATPVSSVHAIEDNMFTVEDSVWFQVCDPELLGIVEDAASFDANRAGSWVGKQSSWSVFSPDITYPLCGWGEF